MVQDPCFKTRSVHCSDGLRGDSSVLEKHNGRNAADLKLGGKSRFFLGIHLKKSYHRLQLCCRAFISRCHGSARAAPRGPEIHHHRNIVALDMGCEGLGGDRNRLSFKQGSVTVSAFCILRRAALGHAVHRCAMGANNMLKLLAHRLFSFAGGVCITRGGGVKFVIDHARALAEVHTIFRDDAGVHQE